MTPDEVKEQRDRAFEKLTKKLYNMGETHTAIAWALMYIGDELHRMNEKKE